MARNVNVTLTWDLSLDASKLPDRAGIYLVLSKLKSEGGELDLTKDKVIDIGQTGEGRTRLASHEREECWEDYKGQNSDLIYKFAVMPSKNYDEIDRLIVECCLRAHTTPQCGKECNRGFNKDSSVTIQNKGDCYPLKAKCSCLGRLSGP